MEDESTVTNTLENNYQYSYARKNLPGPYNLTFNNFIQPPSPQELKFLQLEEAKSYLDNYIQHTNTKLILYHRDEIDNLLQYRCSGFANDGNNNCAFNVNINYHGGFSRYIINTPCPYHSHSILKDYPLGSKLNEAMETMFDLINNGGINETEKIIEVLQSRFGINNYMELNQFELLAIKQILTDFDELLKFVFTLIFANKIDDLEKIRSFIKNSFKNLIVSDELLKNCIKNCFKLKTFIERCLGVCSTNLIYQLNQQNINSLETIAEIQIDPEIKNDSIEKLKLIEKINEFENFTTDYNFDNKLINLAMAATNQLEIPLPKEQSFETMELAKDYLKSYMVKNHIGLVIYKSGSNRGYALYRCELGGNPIENLNKRRIIIREAEKNGNNLLNKNGKLIKKRKRISKKLNCPFKVHIKFDKKINKFLLTIPNGNHNHYSISNNLTDHTIIRKRSPEHFNYLKFLYLQGITKPSILKKKLLEKFPDLHIIDKDVYNDIRKLKSQLSQGNVL